MKKNLFILSFLSLLFIFVSCERNGNEVNIEKKIVEETFVKSKYNEDLKYFSLAVSKAMNASPEFRKIIKEEANLKFDGDYDVVIKRVMNKPVVAPASLSKSSASRLKGSSFSIGELLGEFMLEAAKTSVTSTSMKKVIASPNDVITALTEQYPNLQVSIPVNIENWDEVSETPTVVFIPFEEQEGITTTLLGYKANGTIVNVDAINEPESEPVIVVGMNERIPSTLIPLEPIDQDITPPTPTSFSGAPNETGITLTWVRATEANDINTIGYRIYRKSNGLPDYYLAGTVYGVNNVSFFDSSILYGTTYSYYITSFNYTFESLPTTQILVTTSSLQSPKNIQAITGSTANTIDLQWDGASTGDSYEVYRKKQGDANFISVTIINGLHNNCFTDRNLEGGKIYDYKVRTLNNNGGFSSWSDVLSIHASNRIRGEQLKIKQFKFTDKGQVEPWYRGAAEIIVKAAGSINENQVNFTYSPAIWERDIPRNTWYDCDLPIVVYSWDPNSYGAGMKFQWYEKDSGAEISFSLQADYENKKGGAGWKAGGTFNYKSTDADDFMGEFVVAWWDPKSLIYSTNVIDVEFY